MILSIVRKYLGQSFKSILDMMIESVLLPLDSWEVLVYSQLNKYRTTL